MRNLQQITLLAGILLIVSMAIFPPWVHVDEKGLAQPMGYSFVWKPPVERRRETAEFFGLKLQVDLQSQTANAIDLVRLMTQIAIVGIVTGALAVMLKRTAA